MLADAAQVHQGKLFVIGGGIAVALPSPPGMFTPLAIAGVISLPWEEANKPHTLTIDMVDLDGQPYQVSTATGEVPFRIQANFSTAARPELRRGATLVVPIAVQFPMQLRLGEYAFKVSLNGAEVTDAAIPLYVVAQPGVMPTLS
jgi:hypothetical protein